MLDPFLLGVTLGIMAVLTKSEILFVVIGGIFVIEALSVIIQVSSFKMRKSEFLRWHLFTTTLSLKAGPNRKLL